MLGSGRIFKLAFALNMASRSGVLGNFPGKIFYFVWNQLWNAYLAVRMAIRGEFIHVDVHGLRLAMSLDDRSVTRVLHLFGAYEPAETLYVVNTLRPGMRFVDIGANSGYYSLLASQLVGPEGSVLAFEPDPANAAVLRKNIAQNQVPNVIIKQLAIAASEGEIELFRSHINDGDHRIYNGRDDDFYNMGQTREVLTVQSTSLDQAMQDHSLKPDFIKMDIQGAEQLALQGMLKTLAQNPQLILMTEFWPHGLRRCSGDPISFLHELQQLGFTPFKLGADANLRSFSAQDLPTGEEGKAAETLVFRNAQLHS